MIIFPAIDIRGGNCVRLTKGCFDKETIFSDSPAAMAAKWEALGAKFLHVVDLDGALAGKSVNLTAIKEIVKSVAIPVQLGGGIRSLDNIETALELGVNRVILGSVAVKNPELVGKACEIYGDKVVVGIDAKDGIVAVDGWGISGNVEAGVLAKRMAEVGAKRVVYTDIARDGMLSGVNVAASEKLARISGLKVIASGGVSSLADIAAVKAAGANGVEGVIVGKAIYTGAVDLAAALALAKE